MVIIPLAKKFRWCLFMATIYNICLLAPFLPVSSQGLATSKSLDFQRNRTRVQKVQPIMNGKWEKEHLERHWQIALEILTADRIISNIERHQGAFPNEKAEALDPRG
jgi:hypothetical protein